MQFIPSLFNSPHSVWSGKNSRTALESSESSSSPLVAESTENLQISDLPPSISFKKQGSFQSKLSHFIRVWKENMDVSCSSIQEQLSNLEKAFSREIKLQHPREIYPLYEALTFVTHEIAKRSLSQLSDAWKGVLEALDKRNIYRMGLGIICLIPLLRKRF